MHQSLLTYSCVALDFVCRATLKTAIIIDIDNRPCLGDMSNTRRRKRPPTPISTVQLTIDSDEYQSQPESPSLPSQPPIPPPPPPSPRSPRNLRKSNKQHRAPPPPPSPQQSSLQITMDAMLHGSSASTNNSKPNPPPSLDTTDMVPLIADVNNNINNNHDNHHQRKQNHRPNHHSNHSNLW